jgi:hypothetical protein
MVVLLSAGPAGDAGPRVTTKFDIEEMAA